MSNRIRIAISSCLLGHAVRYDGGHRYERHITETLARFCELVPVCPEVDCGLPVPRETMHLVGAPERPHLLTIDSRLDHTGQMLAWSREQIEELEEENLHGYIGKSKSPSCGLENVPVMAADGTYHQTGTGLFALELKKHFPELPMAEECQLHNPKLLDKFIKDVFAYRRHTHQHP